MSEDSGPALPKRLLTVPEVMAVLSLGRAKVYDLMRSGRLASVTVGRCRRVPIEAIEDCLALLRDEAA